MMDVYLINDQFHGPIIEARSGDTIQLEILNNLEDEEIAMQLDDLVIPSRGLWGAKDSLQKVIVAGAATNYEIQIPDDKAGSYLYYAKSESQARNGVFGVIVVHKSNDSSGTVHEERAVVVSGMNHQTLSRDRDQASASDGHPGLHSILINGVGAYNCSQLGLSIDTNCVSKTGRSRPYMKFVAGKSYRLRFTNAETSSGITISIPGTTMTVIEIDGGQRVRPKRATSIGVLRPGQSVDVLISWSAGGDDEIIVVLDDDNDSGFALAQSFPIKISGFLNRKIQRPAPRYIDILRLSSPTSDNEAR
jgi:FtsP/CotA-like multicopper oxidase with cupredoxin domain